MSFVRSIRGYLNKFFIEPNEDGSLNTESKLYRYDNTLGAWVPDVVSGMTPSQYDQIFLGYTGTDLTTVKYYLSGDLLGTLTLEYIASTLTTVTRS